MDFRDSEPNAAPHKAVMLQAFKSVSKAKKCQNCERIFCDRVSPPEIAFFAGGWNEETPMTAQLNMAGSVEYTCGVQTVVLVCAYFMTKDLT